MKTTTATVINQQSLNHSYSANSFTDIFEVLNNMEFDLQSILVNKLEQGLPSDLDGAV
ncbi:MAG: hypothetical protein AAFX80_17530 [Cyanobacteria bacterium J06639_18]